MNSLKIGSHLSISKGYLKAALLAEKLGANTFQFFTRNPRGGKAKAIDVEDIRELNAFISERDFSPLLAHGSYTMNLCSNKPEVREFAKETLKNDFERINGISNCLYNFHPGSHVGQGVEKGIAYIIEALNEALYSALEIPVLLELMSGKGTEIGKSFEELNAIISGVDLNEKLGVCLDTCHAYSAGYDLVNDLDNVLQHFDEVIGLEKLKAIHLNDSKMPFASNKDRHEKIGLGTLGEEAIKRMINHPLLRDIPFYLETPNDEEGYAKEIRMLKTWSKERT